MKTFVVIDDAPFIRELISSCLRAEGYTCLGEAENGREAVALVARTLPDIIFLDLVMPLKNGVSAAREIRDIWPQGRIVAVSSMGREEVDPRMESTLFDVWLKKPFSKQALIESSRSSGHAVEESA